MVCQNQSIDDSDAPLAHDIRILIRQRIEKGESNNAVRAYLVSRYGDFILLKPRLKLETLLLWLIAPLTLFAGLRSGASFRGPPPSNGTRRRWDRIHSRRAVPYWPQLENRECEGLAVEP
jgi:cytochrome c-type biogenesis protein CcmH